MRPQRTAGWTALVAGAVFLVGVAAASFAPGAVFGGDLSGSAAPAACTDLGHMGATGMMSSGHMAGMAGMMGSTYATRPGAGATPSAPIAGAPEVRVQATNFAFTPSEIRLPAGDAVNLTFENAAATGVVHDFTVPALGIHVAAGPGQTSTVGLRGLAVGRYDAYCSVPGHRDLGMRAVVIVQ